MFFVGCDTKHLEYKPEQDMKNYSCTDDQLVTLNREYAICLTSSYMSSYCFEQAKISQCTYKQKIGK